MTTAVPELFRQREAPMVIPAGATLGVYRIENGRELERTIKVKHVMDAAKLLRDLETDGAWLIYARVESTTIVLALSHEMEAALCLQRQAS